MSLWEASEIGQIAKNESQLADQEYISELKDKTTVRGSYKPFQPEEGDVPELIRIKNRINSIVERELVQQDFKDQLDKEAITHGTYTEVMNRKSFFFEVDDFKRDHNLTVHNFRAPGNIYRKPKTILPHEHVHIDNFMNTEGLEGDKLFELYGYYAYLIDLHIAQVRPDNLDPKSYIP